MNNLETKNLEQDLLQSLLDEIVIRHQKKAIIDTYLDAGYVFVWNPEIEEFELRFEGAESIPNIDTAAILKIFSRSIYRYFDVSDSGSVRIIVNNMALKNHWNITSTIDPKISLSTHYRKEAEQQKANDFLLYLEYFSLRENDLYLSLITSDSSERIIYKYPLEQTGGSYPTFSMDTYKPFRND